LNKGQSMSNGTSNSQGASTGMNGGCVRPDCTELTPCGWHLISR
jgi:hypothetical protein